LTFKIVNSPLIISLKNKEGIMQQQLIKYYDNTQTELHGHLYYTQQNSQKAAAVIVVHDWSGCNEFAKQQAQKLAAHGYVGFAIDMYGEGSTAESLEEKKALMQPLLSDRALLQQRIQAAVQTLKEQPGVDSQHIAAIGFCFGGLCVLDLARTTHDIQGVASFHGLLGAPDNKPQTVINSKVLV